METSEPVDSLDPALGYLLLSYSIMRASCAKLLDYEAESGAAGVRPVPDLADAMPRRSNGGRTYTFAIRRGFRFSPPSGEPVTAQSMKYTIERSLHPRMRSPAPDLLNQLVGEAAFAEGRARHISGIRASGDRLSITLVEPSSSFLHRIALPFFCAVPIDTPIDPDGLRRVPTAGPYYVAAHVPDEEVVLRRNPNYGGSRRASPNELRIALAVNQAMTVEAIEAGTVDYTPIIENPRVARRLQDRYGAGDAKIGEPRFIVKPMNEIDRLIFNTSRQPFSSSRLRRAASYALDRTALAREGLFTELPGQPTDQYLPPSMAGFRDARLYPLRPDVARARRLAGSRRRSVVLYTAGFPSHVRFAEIVRMNLRRIGIDVEIKNVGDSYFQRISRRAEPFDLTLDGWASDYPDPTDVLGQLDGRTIREELNTNVALFDDPAFNRRLDAAENLPSPDRELALGRLDADTARAAAPWAAVANNRRHDFFSGRVGCLRYTAAYGVELASLCVRD
jgi:ABC-type oligopeptide transport system substrate-binding subunit